MSNRMKQLTIGALAIAGGAALAQADVTIRDVYYPGGIGSQYPSMNNDAPNGFNQIAYDLNVRGSTDWIVYPVGGMFNSSIDRKWNANAITGGPTIGTNNDGESVGPFSWDDGATFGSGSKFNGWADVDSNNYDMTVRSDGTFWLWVAPGSGKTAGKVTADLDGDSASVVTLNSSGSASQDHRLYQISFSGVSSRDTLHVTYNGTTVWAVALGAPVPEPSSLGLLGVVGLGLLRRGRQP